MKIWSDGYPSMGLKHGHASNWVTLTCYLTRLLQTKLNNATTQGDE
jgi:hypothetical protein